MSQREPFPGEILKTYVSSKMLYHYGVYAGNGQVIDMAPRRGIALRHWNDFCDGNTVDIEPYFQGDESNAVVLQRAKSYIGHANYSTVFFNCEQFVNMCRRGIKNSEQLSKVGKYAALTVGAAFIFDALLSDD